MTDNPPPAASGPALETFVREDVTTMMIINLLSGTDYSVKVMASYGAGSSEAVSGRAKTCKSARRAAGCLQVTCSLCC